MKGTGFAGFLVLLNRILRVAVVAWVVTDLTLLLLHQGDSRTEFSLWSGVVVLSVVYFLHYSGPAKSSLLALWMGIYGIIHVFVENGSWTAAKEYSLWSGYFCLISAIVILVQNYLWPQFKNLKSEDQWKLVTLTVSMVSLVISVLALTKK